MLVVLINCSLPTENGIFSQYDNIQIPAQLHHAFYKYMLTSSCSNLQITTFSGAVLFLFCFFAQFLYIQLFDEIKMDIKINSTCDCIV